MFLMSQKKTEMVDQNAALLGRKEPLPTAVTHFLNGRSLKADVPEGMSEAMFGMGCFWGVERMFWKLDGVWLSMVGYAAGFTPNATYEEVCTGQTGQNEVIRLIFDPKVISYETLLKVFWEGHNPTQGLRQGNDRGSQYRSGIYTYSKSQYAAACASRDAFEPKLTAAGFGLITTEILDVPEFYYAEGYHQQYLAKNPNGYCGIGGTGVVCPVSMSV